MTNHGFLWLPGVKYQIGAKKGDIDILACCDGRLVFCECKNLKDTPTDKIVWDDVVTQFVATADIGKKCGGSLAVLAALVENFPETFQGKIKSALGDSIPFLLLNKGDLEAGHRDIPFRDITTWLDLENLIPSTFPECPRERFDKPRTINMGWATYTR
jgi:hypothetical protein